MKPPKKAAKLIPWLIAAADRNEDNLPLPDLLVEVRRFYDGPLNAEAICEHLRRQGWEWSGDVLHHPSGHQPGHGPSYDSICTACGSVGTAADTALAVECLTCIADLDTAETSTMINVDELEQLRAESRVWREQAAAIAEFPGLADVVAHAVAARPVTAREFTASIGEQLNAGELSYLGRLASQASPAAPSKRSELGPGARLIEVNAFPRDVWLAVWPQFEQWREDRDAA